MLWLRKWTSTLETQQKGAVIYEEWYFPFCVSVDLQLVLAHSFPNLSCDHSISFLSWNREVRFLFFTILFNRMMFILHVLTFFVAKWKGSGFPKSQSIILYIISMEIHVYMHVFKEVKYIYTYSYIHTYGERTAIFISYTSFARDKKNPLRKRRQMARLRWDRDRYLMWANDFHWGYGMIKWWHWCVPDWRSPSKQPYHLLRNHLLK